MLYKYWIKGSGSRCNLSKKQYKTFKIIIIFIIIVIVMFNIIYYVASFKKSIGVFE